MVPISLYAHSELLAFSQRWSQTLRVMVRTRAQQLFPIKVVKALAVGLWKQLCAAQVWSSLLPHMRLFGVVRKKGSGVPPLMVGGYD